MIHLDCSAAAFLKRGDEYLLMKRSPKKRIAPGVWSAVGGHLEPHELNDPHAACLREIEEETGIHSADVLNLRLRYIIIRRAKDVIRHSYIYFGETDAEPSVITDEGSLHWIAEDELLHRTYTTTFQRMLEHYRQTPDEQRVFVGAAEKCNGRCQMVWTAVEDFE